MLAQLRLELETDSADFGYYQSSNMQGILMEQADKSYAGRMHEQGLKPYSQHLISGGSREWVIKTLTKEAYQYLILPLLDGQFQEFDIEKKNIHVNIHKKELKTVTHQELLDEFYAKEFYTKEFYPKELHTKTSGGSLDIEVLTPASFKSHGSYVNMPDMRLIYQSLMNKYSAVSADMELYDEETLEQLAGSSRIVQYRLRSALFPLEGIRIPSFKGSMRIKINGTDTMARYARLLMRFGEYSGIGIKTAMGMGGIKINDGCTDKTDTGRTAP